MPKVFSPAVIHWQRFVIIRRTGIIGKNRSETDTWLSAYKDSVIAVQQALRFTIIPSCDKEKRREIALL
ncbi:MAG: hypothetical protein AAF660_08855 [Pseudomonadota bacterium]